VGPLLSVPAHKADDVLASFEGSLVETGREELDYDLSLPRDLAHSALVMGPAARHARAEGPAGGDSAAPLEVAARFTVQVLARPGRPSGAPDGTEG
jgi:23S rRNA (guanine745-N1)-methyltransferase